MTIQNANFPSQRPTLSLDFAKTRQLDPRITFSRSSSGTYFDQNGVLQTAPAGVARFDHDPETGESLGLLVEEARTNLILGSTQHVSTYWTTLNVNAIPNSSLNIDGTITAATVISTSTSGQHAYYTTTTVSGTAFAFSLFVKAGTARYVALSDGSNTAFSYTVYDLQLGTVVSSTGINGPGGIINNLGNGWFRITQTGGRNNQWLFILDNSLALSHSQSGLSVIVGGAQVEAGSFPTSYIPTPATLTSRSTTATYYDANGVIQTAGINVARDDAYFPDENGVMRPAGLLLEAAGTNLVTYSEQFDNAFWFKRNGATVTANAVAAPDGTTTADELIHPGGTTYARIETSLGISVTTGNQYTASVFAKFKAGSEANVLAIQFQNASGFIYVNLSTKAVLSGSGVSIQSLSNGWLRVSWTFTATVTGTGQLYLYPTNTTNTAPNPSIAANSGLYIWGAQLEASPYPTSYIPTTTAAVTRAADVSTSAAVTRSADVAQITGTNFSSWFNPDSSSIFTEYKTNQSGWYVPLYSLNDNGSFNAFWLQGYNSNSWNPYLQGLGNGYISTTGGGPFSGNNKVAISLETGSFKMAENGDMNTGVASSNITGPFTAVTRLRFAVSVASSNVFGSITFARLAYYPVRLPDATLQALTL